MRIFQRKYNKPKESELSDDYFEPKQNGGCPRNDLWVSISRRRLTSYL